jgi:hypothetical protein
MTSETHVLHCIKKVHNIRQMHNFVIQIIFDPKEIRPMFLLQLKLKVRSLAMYALVFMLALATTSHAFALGASPLGTDLASWWQFDEGSGNTAADASGLGNNGYLQGEVAFTQDSLMGTALDFTGPSGTFIVPHNPSLEPATGTIEVWVKIAALQNSDILTKLTSLWVRTNYPCGCSVYGLRITENGSAYAFVGNNDPTDPVHPWRTAESEPGLITSEEWHHLVMRWDGSMIAVFVDGVLRGATPYDPVPDIGLSYYNGSDLVVGAGTAWGGPQLPHEFVGQMDDVRFYGRALSDTEIMTDYVSRGHKPATPRKP